MAENARTIEGRRNAHVPQALPLAPPDVAPPPPAWPAAGHPDAEVLANMWPEPGWSARLETDAPSSPDSSAGLRAPAEAYRRLRAVYREVDRRVAALAPTCHARGICCDFDRVDHVLYASRLEIDFVRDGLARERYERDTGNVCPLLVDGRCSAREHRMLGCRTYFCQAGWEPVGAAIYEGAYREIQAIAREHDLPWAYAPALAQLRPVTAASGGPDASAPRASRGTPAGP